MIVRVSVYGLCVVKEGGTSDTIYAIPHFVNGTQTHHFILQAKEQSVNYDELPEDWWKKMGSNWACVLPDKAKLTIPQAHKGVTPTEPQKPPVSLSDLKLSLAANPQNILGEFTLPHPAESPPSHKWVIRLGNFRLKCQSGNVREVADRFVWEGDFHNANQVTVTITYEDLGPKTKNLFLKPPGVELDVICNDPTGQKGCRFLIGRAL